MKDQTENDGDDSRGKGFPQILHDRSRQSGQDLHKLLLSLSTGVLAVYFFALTTKIDPPLTIAQKIVLLFGIIAMSLSALSGILDLYSDSRRNFFWAMAIQEKDKQSRSSHFKSRDKWLKIERRCAWTLTISFGAGICASLIYLVSRVLN